MSYVDPGVNTAVKVVTVTIAAGNSSGLAAHGMGAAPTPGRPNPDRIEGINSIASADATNVTVTLDVSQMVDLVFKVPCHLGLG